MRTNETLRIIEHLIDTVEQIHRKGMLHRGVKPANILLEWDDTTDDAKGFLTDYTLLCPFGRNPISTDYDYGDLCSKAGLALPSCDLIGSAMSLGYAMFGHTFPPEKRVCFLIPCTATTRFLLSLGHT